jgi:hypothetical protein
MASVYFANKACVNCGSGLLETIDGLKCLECSPRVRMGSGIGGHGKSQPGDSSPPKWFLELLRQQKQVDLILETVKKKKIEQETLLAELNTLAAGKSAISKRDPSFAKAKDVSRKIKKLDWTIAAFEKQHLEQSQALQSRLETAMKLNKIAGVPANWWGKRQPFFCPSYTKTATEAALMRQSYDYP